MVNERTMTQRRLLSLGAALLLVGAVLAAQVLSTFQALTVDNTSGGVAISAATLSSGGTQMNYCEGRVETAQIRFRDDGTAPTTTVGTVLEIGDLWRAWSNQTAGATKFIRTGSTSATLDIRCYPTAAGR